MRRVRDKRNLARRLLLFVILTIPFRPIISKIYRTDLRQIFSVGRTMAANDQSEISFSIPQAALF